VKTKWKSTKINYYNNTQYDLFKLLICSMGVTFRERGGFEMSGDKM